MNNNRREMPLEMAETCCSAAPVLLFPCSGGSNVGQLANQAAVKVTMEGAASMYCLAGIGAADEAMISTAGEASKIIAIDGCPVLCSKRTLERAGLTVSESLVLTVIGIKKNKNYNLEEDQLNLVYKQLKALV
jgi:uncharacterized metal-binding protein